MGSSQKTSIRGDADDFLISDRDTIVAHENTSNCEEQNGAKGAIERVESRANGNESGVINKSKKKRNRRKERKTKKNKNKDLKVIGINCAGLLSKLRSFEKLLEDENPTVVCLQETKIRKSNQITQSCRNYTLYELHRKNSNGGGLCIGIQKDLKSVWISQGDDEVECLAVEFWAEAI